MRALASSCVLTELRREFEAAAAEDRLAAAAR
jgi:hypothetical protein